MERQTEVAMRRPTRQGLASNICLILFIRTMTVGSGISRICWTLSRMNAGSSARGLPESHIGIPPVGNFAPP